MTRCSAWSRVMPFDSAIRSKNTAAPSVLMPPGLIAFTRTAFGASSVASPLL